MRHKMIAAFVCLSACFVAKADTVLAANCTITAALCAATPSVVGNLTTIATDFKGEVDASYISGAITNGSYTLYDATYRATVSSAIRVDFDGAHGSSSATALGSGGGIARFTGTITDYFEVAGTVPQGARLKVLYGADVLSNTSATNASGYIATLTLSTPYEDAQCFGTGHHYQGNLSGECAEYVPISTGNITRLILTFYTELDASNKGTVYLDASNTARLDAVTIVDSQGNPISGIQLYDASGYDYDALSAVPEPSPIFFTATGMMFVAGYAKTRRFSSI